MDGKFEHADGKAKLIALAFVDNNERPDNDFPFWLNSAYQDGGGKAPIHMVSAWSAKQNLVLGQVKVARPRNIYGWALAC